MKLVRGNHHPSTATAVGALAQSYWKNNQLAEAWKLSQETYADMANYIRRLYWSMTESERQMHLIGHQTGLDLDQIGKIFSKLLIITKLFKKIWKNLIKISKKGLN